MDQAVKDIEAQVKKVKDSSQIDFYLCDQRLKASDRKRDKYHYKEGEYNKVFQESKRKEESEQSHKSIPHAPI